MPARSPTPSRPDGDRCGRMTRCGYSPRPTAEKAPSTRSRPPFPARSGTRPVSSRARTGGRLPANGSNCPGTSPWSNWPRCAGCRSWLRRTRSARQPTDSGRSSATPSPPAPGRWSSASAAPHPPTADPARCVPWDWCCGMPTGRRSPAAAGSSPGWHPWIAGACCRRRPAESPCSPTSARRSPARTEPPRCSARRRVPPGAGRRAGLGPGALRVAARRRPGPTGHGSGGRMRLRLAAGWGAEVEPGAAYIARLSGLAEAIAGADVVLTGEGRFDATSGTGKVVGELLRLAAITAWRPASSPDRYPRLRAACGRRRWSIWPIPSRMRSSIRSRCCSRPAPLPPVTTPRVRTPHLRE